MIMIDPPQDIIYIDWQDLLVIEDAPLTIELDDLEVLHDFDQEVFQRTNEIRREYGLKPLTYNHRLARCAQDHASDMRLNRFIGHVSSDGSTLRERVALRGYHRWLAIGENCAVGQTTPREVMTGWMNSPGHRQNILNETFTEIGVAYLVGDVPTTGWLVAQGGYWVQNFGTSFPGNSVASLFKKLGT